MHSAWNDIIVVSAHAAREPVGDHVDVLDRDVGPQLPLGIGHGNLVACDCGIRGEADQVDVSAAGRGGSSNLLARFRVLRGGWYGTGLFEVGG